MSCSGSWAEEQNTRLGVRPRRSRGAHVRSKTAPSPRSDFLRSRSRFLARLCPLALSSSVFLLFPLSSLPPHYTQNGQCRAILHECRQCAYRREHDLARLVSIYVSQLITYAHIYPCLSSYADSYAHFGKKNDYCTGLIYQFIL